MAYTLYPVTNITPGAIHKADRGLQGSFLSSNLHRTAGLTRRSDSDNGICCPAGGIRASSLQPNVKNSLSVDLLNIQATLKSFLFDPGTTKEIDMEENLEESEHEDEMKIDCEGKKRANWIERLMELRSIWKGRQENEEGYVVGGEMEGCDEGDGCGVEYEEDGEGSDVSMDRETFSSLLRPVSWSDTRLFSRLAFLCNMAYVIPDIKTGDLRRYYGLKFVTSSLEKKAEVGAIGEKVEQGCNADSISELAENSEPSAAYGIAASAASYVQSLEPDHQIEEDGTSSPLIYKSEMAACVAASTMTAVVAAGEKQKEKAARDLQSLQSSPCEWFVCDDSSIYTRLFVIQGSDSLASWQANLFFEPTRFEGTGVLVHRGIYEAAKGIYAQFMPEIKQHLNTFSSRAKLQFTGHSLGGSLALLVHLMLLIRNEVKPSALLPVVTFGSPFVFCGGKKILEELNIDETHVHSVMMHRDIVPRAFSCKYPNYVAQILKRLASTFRFHPCLNKNKLLYSPMGKLYILQPDEQSSPSHPLLPPGSGLYTLDDADGSLRKSAVRAFLNFPHPIRTLSDPTAYGSNGTIIRDHDSSNYLKAVNEVVRRHGRMVVRRRRSREQRNQMWPLLSSRSPHAWSHTC